MNRHSARIPRLVLGTAALVAFLGMVTHAPRVEAAQTATTLRVIHLATTPSRVGVHVDGGARLELNTGTSSGYLVVTAGAHSVSFDGVGGPPPVDVDLGVGDAVTIATTDVLGGPARAVVFHDELTMPAPGHAGVRAVNGTDGVGALDLVDGGVRLAGSIGPGQASSYAPATAGVADLVATRAGTDLVMARVQMSRLDAGSLHTVALVGGVATLGVRLVVFDDAAGATSVPVGAIETGAAAGGGMGVSATLLGALAVTLLAGVWRRRPLAHVGVAAALGILLLACAPSEATHLPSPPQSSAASDAASSPPPPQLTTAEPPPPPARPVRLQIPSIGVDAAVVPLQIRATGPGAGTLPAPVDPSTVGWFGPAPGTVGPAVLAGHVRWYAQRGVFDRLGSVQRGATVEVTGGDHRVAMFRVAGATTADKADFPTGLVFGPTTDPEIRLVTCTGAILRSGAFAANLVISAYFVGWMPGPP